MVTSQHGTATCTLLFLCSASVSHGSRILKLFGYNIELYVDIHRKYCKAHCDPCDALFARWKTRTNNVGSDDSSTSSCCCRLTDEKILHEAQEIFYKYPFAVQNEITLYASIQHKNAITKIPPIQLKFSSDNPIYHAKEHPFSPFSIDAVSCFRHSRSSARESENCNARPHLRQRPLARLRICLCTSLSETSPTTLSYEVESWTQSQITTVAISVTEDTRITEDTSITAATSIPRDNSGAVPDESSTPEVMKDNSSITEETTDQCNKPALMIGCFMLGAASGIIAVALFLLLRRERVLLSEIKGCNTCCKGKDHQRQNVAMNALSNGEANPAENRNEDPLGNMDVHHQDPMETPQSSDYCSINETTWGLASQDAVGHQNAVVNDVLKSGGDHSHTEPASISLCHGRAERCLKHVEAVRNKPERFEKAYNSLDFARKCPTVQSDAGLTGAAVYSHLNDGEDDTYSKVDGEKKVKVIDSEYSHIKTA